MDEYRYEQFTTSLLFRDLRFRKDSATPGDGFPPFELITTDGLRLVNDDVFGEIPVVFIFGSMTCPMTASAAPSVQELYEEFGDRVKFVMLYVREAHPGEHFNQADNLEQKLEHARALKDFYKIHWTVAADNVAGDLHRALDTKPNAAYLTDKEGTILFRSLWAADYFALRTALDAAASGQPLPASQSTKMLAPLVKAMGYVQEVMKRGGPQAVADLWRAAPPMALAGRVATIFSRLPRKRRGFAAFFSLLFVMILMLGFLGALLLRG